MTNQTTAITPYNRFKDLIKSDNVQERFTQLLDKRKDEFLASLLSLVSADEKLLACDPRTIFAAAAKAAILRLPIAKELGFAWIIPYKNEATFQLGYKGLIQLAIRTGQYITINAAKIYEGEEVTVDRLTGMVKLNGKRTSDEVAGYVSYFKLKNGFEKYLYMDRESVERHGRQYSKSYGNQRSAWTSNFDDMGLVTVLRLLLRRYGLLSIEMIDGDEQEAPYIGNDPRLAMPKFDDMGEGDGMIESQLSDPEPTPPEAQPAQAPQPPAFDAAAWIVEQGQAENVHNARAILKKCKLQEVTPETLAAWMKAYRGWRDMGADSDKAAGYANSGELPK